MNIAEEQMDNRDASPTDRALSDLENAISSLRNDINVLSKRLEPVSRKSEIPVDPSLKEIRETHGESDVVQTIENRTTDIEDAQRIVRRMTNYLEV